MAAQQAVEAPVFEIAPRGVTLIQSIHLPDLFAFKPDKRVRTKLFEGAQLWSELVCYEPGQGTPSHYHPNEDEMFITLEGHGTISAGDEAQFEVRQGTIVTVPAAVKHTMAADRGERWIVMFVKLSRSYGKVNETPGAGSGRTAAD